MSQPAQLQANSFGWGGQFFQGLAHMAPAAGIIMTAQFMATRAGSALPLAIGFAAVLALMVGGCLGMLTRKYHGASGYFQIHSQALGSRLGFTTSWLFFLYEPVCAFATSLGFAALIIVPFARAQWNIDLPWWSVVLDCNLVVLALALINVRNSIRTTAVLGIIEFLIIALLGLLLVSKGEPGFHPEYFTPAASADGWGGLTFALHFRIHGLHWFRKRLASNRGDARCTPHCWQGFADVDHHGGTVLYLHQLRHGRRLRRRRRFDGFRQKFRRRRKPLWQQSGIESIRYDLGLG